MSALIFILCLVLYGCGPAAEPNESGADKTSSNKIAQKNNSSLGVIKKRGKLRVAVPENIPPISYPDNEGKYKGFNVEFAKRLAEDLLGSPDKLELVPTKNADRETVLTDDKADISLMSYVGKPDAGQNVDFAGAYMKASVSLISLNGEVKNINDIPDKKIIVCKGTVAEQFLETNYSYVNLIKVDSYDQMFKDLEEGQASAAACDMVLAYSWSAGKQKFDVSIKNLTSKGDIEAAVKKGDTELQEWVKNEIVTLRSQDFFRHDFQNTMQAIYGGQLTARDVLL